jgi:hypothetical protein
VSRIDDASVCQSIELVNTTVKCQHADRFDEGASMAATIKETSNARRELSNRAAVCVTMYTNERSFPAFINLRRCLPIGTRTPNDRGEPKCVG